MRARSAVPKIDTAPRLCWLSASALVFELEVVACMLRRRQRHDGIADSEQRVVLVLGSAGFRVR